MLEGVKWYGYHLGAYRTPAREDDPPCVPAYFYEAQHAHVLQAQRGQSWTWSTTRPGAVCGYANGARLNPHALGLGLLTFVEVSLDKTTPDAFERFAEAVKRAPEVLECHMVAGGFDYLIKARLADMAAYRRFLGETLLAMPGVRETRTYAVMEEVKNDGPLPL